MVNTMARRTDGGVRFRPVGRSRSRTAPVYSPRGTGCPAIEQAVQRALELSRHPMLGGPRDGATKSLPQTRPGGNPDPRDPAPVTTVVQSIIGGLSARPHRAE